MNLEHGIKAFFKRKRPAGFEGGGGVRVESIMLYLWASDFLTDLPDS